MGIAAQVEGNAVKVFLIGGNVGFFSFCVVLAGLLHVLPVSYTHLDVYKRQPEAPHNKVLPRIVVKPTDVKLVCVKCAFRVFLQIGTYAVHQIMSTAPFDACTGCRCV